MDGWQSVPNRWPPPGQMAEKRRPRPCCAVEYSLKGYNITPTLMLTMTMPQHTLPPTYTHTYIRTRVAATRQTKRAINGGGVCPLFPSPVQPCWYPTTATAAIWADADADAEADVHRHDACDTNIDRGRNLTYAGRGGGRDSIVTRLEIRRATPITERK